MRTIAYSIIGLFFLSLLLVATSFADEGSVCHNGLQPYVDTSSEDTSQSPENEHIYQREYGLQPCWGTSPNRTWGGR